MYFVYNVLDQTAWLAALFMIDSYLYLKWVHGYFQALSHHMLLAFIAWLSIGKLYSLTVNLITSLHSLILCNGTTSAVVVATCMQQLIIVTVLL